MNTYMIPTLTKDGILPHGVYPCFLTDVERIFTTIPDTIQRRMLFENLKNYITILNDSQILFNGILVDGSYVTDEISPSDIDIAVILNPDFSRCDCDQSHLRLIDSDYVKKFYGFSLFTVIDDSMSLRSVVEFYQQQYPPNDSISKGILRVIT